MTVLRGRAKVTTTLPGLQPSEPPREETCEACPDVAPRTYLSVVGDGHACVRLISAQDHGGSSLTAEDEAGRFEGLLPAGAVSHTCVIGSPRKGWPMTKPMKAAKRA